MNELKTMTTCSKTLLAIVVIFMLWIMWFSMVGLLSEICKGKYFWHRVLFSIPFTYVSIFISGVVWRNCR